MYIYNVFVYTSIVRLPVNIYIYMYMYVIVY